MNISKSGVGFSFGGNGFRVAFMPDGRIRRTITIPGTGLSHIEDISPSKRTVETQGTYQSWTGTVRESGHDAVSQHYEKACRELFKKLFAWKVKIMVGFALFCVLSVIVYFAEITWLIIPAIAAMVVAFIAAKRPPAPIQIEYDFSCEPNAYTQIRKFFSEIKGCKSLFHVSGATVGVRRRTNAGAKQNLQMDKFHILQTPETYIKSNVECFLVKLKGMDIFVLPDITIIAKGHKDVKVIDTSSVQVKYYTDNVIWYQKVPGDSIITGKTWQYVNNDGSPDRRFKDNKQVPICQFGAVEIKNPEGLHIVLYGSNAKKMHSAYEAVAH